LDPDPKLGGKWDPDPKKIVTGTDPQHWYFFKVTNTLRKLGIIYITGPPMNTGIGIVTVMRQN
jgi:hypothetical protein